MTVICVYNMSFSSLSCILPTDSRQFLRSVAAVSLFVGAAYGVYYYLQPFAQDAEIERDEDLDSHAEDTDSESSIDGDDASCAR